MPVRDDCFLLSVDLVVFEFDRLLEFFALLVLFLAAAAVVLGFAAACFWFRLRLRPRVGGALDFFLEAPVAWPLGWFFSESCAQRRPTSEFSLAVRLSTAF